MQRNPRDRELLSIFVSPKAESLWAIGDEVLASLVDGEHFVFPDPPRQAADAAGSPSRLTGHTPATASW